MAASNDDKSATIASLNNLLMEGHLESPTVKLGILKFYIAHCILFK